MTEQNLAVFAGVSPEEYEDMAACGCIRRAEYRRETVIFRTGDRTDVFGVLLAGKVHVESLDLWGNRMILHSIGPGQAFAETYAFCQVPMMVDVKTVEESRVLFVDAAALLSPANRNRAWYPGMLRNLLLLSAEKNLAWSRRMFCISPKSVRTRVMTYLSAEARRLGSRKIAIPFDRQQMADYLNVERSALSKELGRMREEGILDFRKNQFSLLRPDEV